MEITVDLSAFICITVTSTHAQNVGDTLPWVSSYPKLVKYVNVGW